MAKITFNPSSNDQQRFGLSALYIALLGSFSAVPALHFLVWRQPLWQHWAMLANAVLLLLALSLSTYWWRHGQLTRAAWLTLLSGEIAFIIGGTLTEGFGWLFATSISVIVLILSQLLLPSFSQRRWAWISVALSALLLILLDAFSLPYRIRLPETFQNFFALLFGTIVILYVLVVSLRSTELRLRILITFLSIALVPLSALSFTNLRALETTQRENAAEQLRSAARLTASHVDELIVSSLEDVRTYAQLPQIAEFLITPPAGQEYAELWNNIQITLSALSRRDSVNILSIGILDNNGWNLIDSSQEYVGRSEAERDYFQQAMRSGLPVVTPVYADENALYFAAPIRGQRRPDAPQEILGVLRIKYSASILQFLIKESGGLVGADSFAILVDQHSIFLAHGVDSTAIYKIAAPISPSLLSALQEAHRLPKDTSSLNLTRLANVLQSQAWQGIHEVELSGAGETLYAVAIFPLESQPWKVIYATSRATFLLPIQRQQQTASLLFVLFALVTGAISYFFIQALTTPILQLTQATDRLRQGILDIVIPIRRRDEIGQLAEAFQTMANRLRDLITSLEQRVAERTRDLEERSSYLQATAEIGSRLVTTLDPNILEQEAVELIRERFNLYYVGLFELDGTGEWAHLRAGTGEAGRRMLERGHRIRVGTGMIGWAIQHAQARIAQQAELDEVRLRTPELPETRSEAALPLRSRNRVLGALSIQSAQPNAFNPDNLAIFQILADQIATALDNARLFTQSEETLASLQRLYAERTKLEWKSAFRYLGQTLAFRSDGYTVRAISPNLSKPARQALQTGQPIVVNEAQPVSGDHQIYIPIKVRGTLLGVLSTYKPAERGPWTEDEIAALSTICEQVGLALDAARLFHEARRRAVKEHTIREISARISETVEISEIMQIAVEELGRALGSAEITLQLHGQEDNVPH